MSLKVDNIIMDPSNDKFKDECGVFGVYSNREMDVASMTYYGLYALQHRGQEIKTIYLILKSICADRIAHYRM